MSKLRTFSRTSSPMLTLFRVASAAHRLVVLTAESVREPRRDRCGWLPSHHRAMWIFKPLCLVSSRPQDSHLCARLSTDTSSSVRSCFFLKEITMAASFKDPSASAVTLAEASVVFPSISAASTAYSILDMSTELLNCPLPPRSWQYRASWTVF